MKILLTVIAVFLSCTANCQSVTTTNTMGFIYSPGIEWTENKKQDSVIDIIIKGDTMTAIRNLLNYCLQQKKENDNAAMILSMINLAVLKKQFNDRVFTFYVNEYNKAVREGDKKKEKFRPKI